MAKPFIPVILEKYIDDFGYTLKVIQSEKTWVVTLNGKPIGLKKHSDLADITKYRRTIFNQKGSALSLANRLNEIFNIKDFDIKEIS